MHNKAKRRMRKKTKITGAGLICIDIVNDGLTRKIMNGGSCANVISVLSQTGYDCTVIREKYSGDLDKFLSNTLKSLGVMEICYRDTRSSVPRIIEALSNTHHEFYTVCPCCGRKILNLKMPSFAESEVLFPQMEETDVFYCDRTSDGLRNIMAKVRLLGGMVFYEPNSARNLEALLQTVVLSDVVKFSKQQIPLSIAEKIRTLENVKLIIYTDGSKGLSFSCRLSDGQMSSWVSLPSDFNGPVVDSSGAGDWLSAGFLSELLKSGKTNPCEMLNSIEEVSRLLTIGMRYSKLCCAAIGAQGFFYSPEYHKEFGKLVESKKRIYNLKMQKESFSSESLCPECLSPL